MLVKYRTIAISGLLSGLVLYSLLMTQQLTNTFDGLWQQNYNHAGIAELALGRWLLHFIDKLVMGVHADPITSILALSLYIAGFLLVLDLFDLKHKIEQYLCMALFISSTLISNTLSYRFTSLGYGTAFFLAALSIYVIIKVRNHCYSICAAGILLGLSMACYQAYLAAFCTVASFYAIYCCNETKAISSQSSSNGVICYLIRVISCVCIGILFYYVSLMLCLKLYNVSLSSYNGVNQLSLGSVLSDLPQSIFKTYQFFYAYFFMDTLKINRLQPFGIFYFLMALLIGMTICIASKAWKGKKKRLLLLLFPALAIIPIASNAYMLLAGDKLELQMTAGLAMFAPLTMAIAFSCIDEKRFSRIACILLCIALAYGSSMQVWVDQEAMYEGQNSCDTMITQVISDLNQKDLLSSDYEYFFVGVPENNSLFSVSDTYYCANAYAQMGRFWTSGNCCQMSYEGLINRRMGLNLPISYLPYENVSAKLNVAEMPEFPRKGYITMLGENTVVIKISEHKAYTGGSKYVITPVA